MKKLISIFAMAALAASMEAVLMTRRMAAETESI